VINEMEMTWNKVVVA